VVNPLLLLMLSATPVFQDPTLPLEVMPDAPPLSTQTDEGRQQHRLQAVLLGGKEAGAIIDGRLYRQGDRVGSYRLVRIGRLQVRLEAQGESLELRLFSPLTLQDMP
jgi:MSHA biogenesis protein MshK